MDRRFKCYMGYPIRSIVEVRIIQTGYGGLALVECIKTGVRDWISQYGLQSPQPLLAK